MSRQPPPTVSEILARAAALESSRDARRSDDEEMLAGLAAGTLEVARLDDATLEELVARHGVDTVVDAVLSVPLRPEGAVTPPTIDGAFEAGVAPVRTVLPFLRARRARWTPTTRWLAAAAAACVVTTMTLAWVWRAEKVPTGQIARDEVRHADEPAPRDPDVGRPVTSAKTVLVLVRGDDLERVRQGEEALLRIAVDRYGFQPAAPVVVSSLREDRGVIDAALREDVATLAEISRRYGLDAIVVGDIEPRAALLPSPAEPLEKVALKLYRAGGGESLVSRDILVERDFAKAVSAATEAEVRAAAARELMTRTATALRDWLERWNDRPTPDRPR